MRKGLLGGMVAYNRLGDVGMDGGVILGEYGYCWESPPGSGRDGEGVGFMRVLGQSQDNYSPADFYYR